MCCELVWFGIPLPCPMMCCLQEMQWPAQSPSQVGYGTMEPRSQLHFRVNLVRCTWTAQEFPIRSRLWLWNVHWSGKPSQRVTSIAWAASVIGARTALGNKTNALGVAAAHAWHSPRQVLAEPNVLQSLIARNGFWNQINDLTPTTSYYQPCPIWTTELQPCYPRFCWWLLEFCAPFLFSHPCFYLLLLSPQAPGMVPATGRQSEDGIYLYHLRPVPQIIQHAFQDILRYSMIFIDIPSMLQKPADRLGKVVLANEVSIRGSGGWSRRVAPKSRN